MGMNHNILLLGSVSFLFPFISYSFLSNSATLGIHSLNSLAHPGKLYKPQKSLHQEYEADIWLRALNTIAWKTIYKLYRNYLSSMITVFVFPWTWSVALKRNIFKSVFKKPHQDYVWLSRYIIQKYCPIFADNLCEEK